MPGQSYKLVLVEDSDDDVVLFELALRRAGLQERFGIMRRCRSGEEAIQYLTDPPSVMDEGTRPDFVVLDLKMPGQSGFDVLSAIRKMDGRPVIGVFTTSILPEDREMANQLGADLYQTKTFQADEFTRFLNWLASLVDQRRKEKS